MGDEGLLERANKGDGDAVSRLFARYQGPIYRYAVHMCGRDAGDDIVQETFLTVMRQPQRYDPARGPVMGYLLGIARNFALKRLTSRGAAFSDELDEHDERPDPAQETALDSLTRMETIEAVRAGVQSLPPLYREVVVLCELAEARALGRARRLRSYAAAATLAAAVLVAMLVPPWQTITRRPPAADADGRAQSFDVLPAVEVMTEFFPLMYSNVPVTDGQTVRLELPQAALASFGLAPGDASATGSRAPSASCGRPPT